METRLHLRRTGEDVAEIAALSARLGDAVGLAGLLDDLHRQARPARGWLGRAVTQAYAWDRADTRDRRWWPQGISTSADASDAEVVGGRRVLVTTWYGRRTDHGHSGSRLTFLDLETLRYRHVLLVRAGLDRGRLTLSPVAIHAGGVVWYSDYLHLAATRRGLVTCRVDDLLRVPDTVAADPRALGATATAVSTLGYRYVLPVRFSYRAHAEQGLPGLRYSFLSLDRSGPAPHLVTGEYGAPADPTRLARFPIDPATALLEAGEDGLARPVSLHTGGVHRMQGVAVVGDTWYLSVSQGPFLPGSVFVGRPGDLRQHRFATPMGPEDVSYWPSTDTLWSVSEHPGRRWVYAMRRGWFDR